MIHGALPTVFLGGGGGQQSPPAMGVPLGFPPPMLMANPPYCGARRKATASPHIDNGGTALMNPLGLPSLIPNRMSITWGSGDLTTGVDMSRTPDVPNAGLPHGHYDGGRSSHPQILGGDMMNMNFAPTDMGMPCDSPQTLAWEGILMDESGISDLGAGQGGMGGAPIVATSIVQSLVQQQHQHQQHHQRQHLYQRRQRQHQRQRQQQQMGRAPLSSGASPLSKQIAPSACGRGGGQMRTSVPPTIPGSSSISVIPLTPAIVVSSCNTFIGAPNAGAIDAVASSPLLPTPSGSSILGQSPPFLKNVELDPTPTQITPLAPIDSPKHVLKISEEDIGGIQGWTKADKEYDGVLTNVGERVTRVTVEVRDMFEGAMCWEPEEGSPGVGADGWERQYELKNLDVRYPLGCGKEKEGRESRKRRREGLRLPRKLEPEEAERPEQLVPIRLEFDVEHHKMRDAFVWNLNDPVVTPEVFAQSIVDDYALAPSYHSVIVKSIQEQLSDYRAHSFDYNQDSGELVVDLKSEKPLLQGALDDSHSQWWEAWRRMGATSSQTAITEPARFKKKRKLDAPGVTTRVEDEEKSAVIFEVSMDGINDEGYGRPMVIDEIMLDEELTHEEMRILIKLDIIVGAMRLEDQFEWDLESGTVTPEEFSEIYAQDLGLEGEFKTAIAHNIREQIQTYRKSLFLVGHPSDGTPIRDEKLRQAFLPSLTAGARPMSQRPSYTPVLNAVGNSDIERSEKKHEREMKKRRKCCQRGRRGILIPGREPVRTHRTPANGFPKTDPATLKLTASANSASSRRAAATAASLMIANMFANENDTIGIHTLPTVPRPQPTKEKKLKGFFEIPPVLPSVPAPSKSGPPLAILRPPQSLKPKIKVTPEKSVDESERETIEKEFADGQYPNWINGNWHCSNCGCPKSMTLGRRRGPLGDKSLCGLCGKFWHRHRRPMPVEYNPDPEFHMRQGSDFKAPVKKKAGPRRAQNTAATVTPADTPTASTPTTSGGTGAASRHPSSPLVTKGGKVLSRGRLLMHSVYKGYTKWYLGRTTG